jgi:hypothetical protein
MRSESSRLEYLLSIFHWGVGLSDRPWNARMWAANVIGGMGPSAKDAIPALIQTLNHEHKYVRSSAAQALGSMGSEASVAVPALTELLKDHECYVRMHAPEAIWKVNRHPDAIARQIISTRSEPIAACVVSLLPDDLVGRKLPAE